MFSIIKNNEVSLKERRVINTLYCEHINNDDKKDNIVELEAGCDKLEIEAIKNNIVENANLEKEKIIAQAIEKAKEIEKDAYEKGYSQGIENGHEDAYKEAYEENLQKADEDILNMKKQAQEFIISAQEEYEKYLSNNRNNIISLVFKMAEQLTKKHLVEEDGLNSLIEEVIDQAKNCKNIIIKCNEKHKASLEEQVEVWKQKFSLTDNLFIIIDNSLAEGNAVIEKENGKSKVGIDAGLEKLREALM